MKTHWGVEVELRAFLDGGQWSASRPYRFILGVRTPGIHSIGGRVCPRAGLDAVAMKKNPIIVAAGN